MANTIITSASLRIAALDLTSLETVMAVGGNPIAVTSLENGNDDGVVGFKTAGMTNLGSVFAPNLEILQRLKPDLITCNEWQTNLLPIVRRIAPSYVFNVNAPTPSPLDNSRQLVKYAGHLLGRPKAATAYLQASDNTFVTLSAAVKQVSELSILVGTLLPDGRHMVVFCEGCIFHDVLLRLGIKNAWRGAPTRQGHSIQGIEVLAEYPNTPFLYLDDEPQSQLALAALRQSALWNSLAIVQNGMVRPIEPEWPFGGLPTAMRFAASVTKAMQSLSGSVRS